MADWRDGVVTKLHWLADNTGAGLLVSIEKPLLREAAALLERDQTREQERDRVEAERDEFRARRDALWAKKEQLEGELDQARKQRDEELRERLERRARNAEGQASLARKQNPHAAIRLDAKAEALRDFADSIFEEADDAD